MNVPANLHSELSLVPLGAGDLIDRAVRFYRKNFGTFVLIAAPPVIVASVVSVIWTMAGREIFSGAANQDAWETSMYYVFVGLGNVLIWLTETIATLVVMGGASRNFVRHLLFGESITFRETYRNSWDRIGGLIAASSLITIVLGVLGITIFYFGAIVGVLAIGLVVLVFSFVPFVATILSISVGLGAVFGSLWLFFLAASRLAYVPQVMLVEGQGVLSAIGRSSGLAGGNIRRLGALFIFTTVAAYSALAILYVPLAWYAAANGVEILGSNTAMVPAWYEIANNLISQISLILLTPVWMIGLCLLYIDERVRAEGYDIELMAAARLGDIPKVPDLYVNPLQPALSLGLTAQRQPTGTRGKSITTLGLD